MLLVLLRLKTHLGPFQSHLRAAGLLVSKSDFELEVNSKRQFTSRECSVQTNSKHNFLQSNKII